MRHIAFFRGLCGKQLFSPCFISFAQLRRISQNPQQIAVWIQAVLLRRFNQAVDYAAGPRTTGCIGKQPVLPAHYKGLNAALGTVVAQLQTAILQIPCQIRPLLQQVVDGLPQRGFRRSSRLHLFAHDNSASKTGFSCSSRLYNRMKPSFSQYKPLMRSRRRPQNRNRVLVNDPVQTAVGRGAPSHLCLCADLCSRRQYRLYLRR